MATQPNQQPTQQGDAPDPERLQVRVPFYEPFIGEEEVEEVAACLRKGWITTGAKAAAFETNFANYIGGGVEAVAVNSGTAGLHLALEAIGISPGDEVIVPVNTFTATAEVVRYLGASPVFVDIDYATMNMDADAIEAKITVRTKALMPVHIAGLPADMTRIIEIARSHGLKVIEDAAHALPTEVGGRRVGSLGTDATVFSFYATKTITTGEGGMIATRHGDIARRCRIMRLHGIDRDVFERGFGDGASWRYDVVAPGYKYNMTDIAASIGIHQLARADTFQARREALAGLYDDLLKDLPLTLPVKAGPGDRHAWHLYIIRLGEDAALDRDALIGGLAAAGIMCSVHFIPLHRMTYWRETYGLTPQDFPEAEKSFEGCVSLPLFPRMTEEQVALVASSMTQLLS